MNSKIYGPGSYEDLAEVIEQDGSKLAPMGETVSLMHPAYKGLFSFLPFGRRKQIRKIMTGSFFYAFTDVHNFPGDITFYHDFNQLKDRLLNPTQKELEGMLGSREEKGVVFSDDGLFRMVKGRYKVGELNKGELSSHPNIIGQTGSLESAYELDEIASIHQYNPRLYLLRDIKELVTTCSALLSDWDFESRLGVYGDGRGDHGGGSAFGVQIAPKACAEK